MKNYFLPALVLFVLPQFALGCGLLETTSSVEIGTVAVLSAFPLSWLSMVFRNNYVESRQQKIFLSINKGVLVTMLVVSPLWVVFHTLFLRTACIPVPREEYFSSTFPLGVFVVSLVFYFFQRRWNGITRLRATVWFLFFGLLIALYFGGYAIPEGTTVPAGINII